MSGVSRSVPAADKTDRIYHELARDTLLSVNERSELLPRVSGWSEKKGVKFNYFKQDFS